MAFISQKLMATLLLTLFFLILSSNFAYKTTNSIGLETSTGNYDKCPTRQGVWLHAFVFALLTYFSMGIPLPILF